MTITEHPFSIPIALGVALLGSILSGCGPSKGSVSGKVTYQGKTVVFGGVNCVDSEGIAHNVSIQPDGTYSIGDVRTGTAKFGVTSPDPAKYFTKVIGIQRTKEGADAAKAEAAKVDRTKWFPIPEKLIEPETSGLSFDLKGSTNTYNIELK